MRTIERTSQFKRDYKREVKGIHRKTLESDFIDVVTALANDQPLIEKHRDHSLTGDWKEHRDCSSKLINPEAVASSTRRIYGKYSTPGRSLKSASWVQTRAPNFFAVA